MRERVAAVLVTPAVLTVLAVLGGCGPSTSPLPSPSSTAPGPGSTSASTGASSALPASSTSTAPAALIAAATWVRGSGGRSLHVVPTTAGRSAQDSGDEDRAWAEVVHLAPDADQPGMRAQFDCHWVYARLVQPGKPTWNLEPWRPVVSDQQMVDARCNPGGPESADG